MLKIYLEDSYKNSPYAMTLSSARECYSQKTITPQECQSWEPGVDLFKSLHKAGHTTTLEHWHGTFAIEGLSRHFIWRYLHAHPFYSSDQQSQRYVEMKPENFYYPPCLNDKEKKEWTLYYDEVFKAYYNMIPILEKAFEEKSLLNKTLLNSNRKNKKAMEIARYLLPISQTANLKHTMNFITIVRVIGYLKAVETYRGECWEEAGTFSDALIDIIIAQDKENVSTINSVIQSSIEEHNRIYLNSNFNHIDSNRIKDIEKEKKMTNIISHNLNLCKELGFSKDSAINSPVMPNSNVLEDFTSEILVSHSCDSQNQRHRTSWGYRPQMKDYFDALDTPYYIPPILFEVKEAYDIYMDILSMMYEKFEEVRQSRDFHTALYLLPNAQRVYFFEKNNMVYFPHKVQKRLCYNAQEEIFNMTKEMVYQLSDIIDIDNYGLKAPCHIRDENGINPKCPEGNLYCGTKVWKMSLDEMERII